MIYSEKWPKSQINWFPITSLRIRAVSRSYPRADKKADNTHAQLNELLERALWELHLKCWKLPNSFHVNGFLGCVVKLRHLPIYSPNTIMCVLVFVFFSFWGFHLASLSVQILYGLNESVKTYRASFSAGKRLAADQLLICEIPASCGQPQCYVFTLSVARLHISPRIFYLCKLQSRRWRAKIKSLDPW